MAITLFVGTPAKEYRRQTEYLVDTVKTIDEVRDLVAKYTGVRSIGRTLVIEDFAFISEQAQQCFLKFLEETLLDVVLLSTLDSVISTIVSRCSSVEKNMGFSPKTRFLPIGASFRQLDELVPHDAHDMVKQRRALELSPMLFTITTKSRYNQRVLNIVN